MDRKPNIRQLMREADQAATRYWKLGASDREKGYELWMKKVQKVNHFIDIFNKKDNNVDL